VKAERSNWVSTFWRKTVAKISSTLPATSANLRCGSVSRWARRSKVNISEKTEAVSAKGSTG